MAELLAHVEQSIRRRNFLRRDDSVLLAVSGGVDSMVLLHIFHSLAARHSWQLSVAHLNHRLRGRSSDADERLVIRTARKLGVPVVSESADVKAVARAGKVSIEMAARKLRHEFLARTAVRLKIRRVALAHHADDQLELFFLRLFRGSGNEGISGMKWGSPSPANPRVRLIRPLLDVPKESLIEFADEHGIQFREDATNKSGDMQRNRIRRKLIPFLRDELGEGVSANVSRTIETARAEAEFVTQVASDWLKGRLPAARRSRSQDGAGLQPARTGRMPFPPSGAAFGELSIAVQRRVIQLQLRELKVATEFNLVERLRLEPDCPIMIQPGRTIRRDINGQLHADSSVETHISDVNPILVILSGSAGEIELDDAKLFWRKHSGRLSGNLPRRANQEWFDADQVGDRIILRHWQPGDRMQPIGMSVAVKLQDLFTNLKIPREQRRRLIVATTAAGEVFWVETLRISERFKLSEQTIRRLHWRWKRL